MCVCVYVATVCVCCIPECLLKKTAKGNPMNDQTSDQCKQPQLTQQECTSYFHYFYTLYLRAYKVCIYVYASRHSVFLCLSNENSL